MRAVFSILDQATARRVDAIVQDAGDIREIESKVRPVLLDSKYKSTPTPGTLFGLMLRLSIAVKESAWGQGQDDQCKAIIKVLVNGLGSQHKWKGRGTRNYILGIDPYKWMLSDSISIYREVMTILGSLGSRKTGSARASPMLTLDPLIAKDLHDNKVQYQMQRSLLEKYSGKERVGTRNGTSPQSVSDISLQGSSVMVTGGRINTKLDRASQKTGIGAKHPKKSK